VRHRLRVKPPDTQREATLRWLTPAGDLRLPLRHYPLDRSTPLVEPGATVVADARLSEPCGALSVPVFAPLAGTVTGLEQGAQQLVLRLRPEPDSSLGAGFPNPVTHDLPTATEIVSLLNIYPLLDNHLPLLTKRTLLAAADRHRVVINCLDSGVFMETRLRLLSVYPEQLATALQLLEQLFETRPLLALPQEHRRQLADKVSALPAVQRWVHNSYPAHLEHLVAEKVTARRLSPADLPEVQGICVIELETLLHLYHLAVRQRPSPWQWLSLFNPINGRVEVLLTTRGVTRAWLPAAYGESDAWLAGDGYRRQTSPFAPLRGMIFLERRLPDQPGNCIRCEFCLKICPEELTPFYLAGLVDEELWPKAERFGLPHCCLCGNCAMVCPAHIDLLAPLLKGIAELHGI